MKWAVTLSCSFGVGAIYSEGPRTVYVYSSLEDRFD